jgi:fructose/tagatose bisphosphate aldolase
LRWRIAHVFSYCMVSRSLPIAIAAGITVVHINTEVRIAWRRGMDRALSTHANEIVPYKILPLAVDSVKEVVTARLALFGSGRLDAPRASR